MEEPYPGEAATGVRQDGLVAPGDEPRGVEEFGVTAAEERQVEPLAMRVQREQPDVGAGLSDDGEWARVVDPDQGWIEDDEGDVIGSETVNDGSALSAEEAAIHVTSEDDAPGLAWDDSPGYLDDDERAG